MKPHYVLLFCTVLLLCACASFKHGETNREALNKYNLITGDKNNFGDQRLASDKVFYKNSGFDNFLRKAAPPEMIYEFETNEKHGIKLFYTKTNQVYVFESATRTCTCMDLKRTEPPTQEDIRAYRKLTGEN